MTTPPAAQVRPAFPTQHFAVCVRRGGRDWEVIVTTGDRALADSLAASLAAVLRDAGGAPLAFSVQSRPVEDLDPKVRRPRPRPAAPGRRRRGDRLRRTATRRRHTTDHPRRVTGVAQPELDNATPVTPENPMTRKPRDADGPTCRDCKGRIGPGEPVFRCGHVYWRGGLYKIMGYECQVKERWFLTTLCRTCLVADWCQMSRRPHPGPHPDSWPTDPCDWCGRPVAVCSYLEPRHRNFHFCSRACRQREADAARSRRRAEARKKRCAACGARFTAGRSDAATCSPACRQKRHRDRRRDRAGAA